MLSLSSPQPRKHRGEILRADIEIFTNPAPQHRGGHIPVTTLLLRFVKYVEHDPFGAREPVPNVGKKFTERIAVRFVHPDTIAAPTAFGLGRRVV